MRSEEEAEIARKLLHYWRLTNLVFDMAEQLRGAVNERDALAIGVHFAAQAIGADGACAFCLRKSGPEIAELVCWPEGAGFDWSQLLAPQSPFRRQVIEQGEIWQDGDGLSGADTAKANSLAPHVLAVPLKGDGDAVLGTLLAWRDAASQKFRHPERELMQFCTSLVALVIGNSRLVEEKRFLSLKLEEKMKAWEAAQHEMGYQFRSSMMLMDLWLDELGQLVRVLCRDDHARLQEHEHFLAQVRAVFRDTEAMTREFLFDPTAPANRIQLSAKEKVHRVVDSIPRAAGRVAIEGPGGLVFANSRRVEIALRDILQATLSCLPEGGRVEIYVGPAEDNPEHIGITFKLRASTRLSPDGSVFQFGQDKLVRNLIEMERGAYREWHTESEHFVSVTWPVLE